MASSTRAESFVPAFDLLAYYAIFFLSGWALFVTPGLRERIEGQPGHYCVLATLALPPALALYLLQDEPAIGAGRWFHLLALLLLSISTWSIVLGLLGVSRRYLAAHSPRLRLWADASYWIYLSHFAPMAALAAALLAVQMPETLRFAILVGATLGLVYPAYRAFVRHSAVGKICTDHGRTIPSRESLAHSLRQQRQRRLAPPPPPSPLSPLPSLPPSPPPPPSPPGLDLGLA